MKAAFLQSIHSRVESVLRRYLFPSASAAVRSRVYLETAALAHAKAGRRILKPTVQNLDWGGRTIGLTVYESFLDDPAERVSSERLRQEIKLLPEIAKLAFDARIELLVQVETLVEMWGLPRTGGAPFFSAPITTVNAPLDYGRTIAGGFIHPKTLQYDFLRRIRHPRFIEHQKACGAFQGAALPSKNQIRDAFNVWCAEAAGADYLLTCDLSLIAHLARQKWYRPGVKVVSPSALIDSLSEK